MGGLEMDYCSDIYAASKLAVFCLRSSFADKFAASLEYKARHRVRWFKDRDIYFNAAIDVVIAALDNEALSGK